MRISWMIIGALGVVLAPSTARAIEVMCQNDQGVVCTIDGDAGTFECTCDGAPLGGTTGSSENPWADATEAELLEACEELLSPECSLGESTTTGGTGNADETGPVTGTPDTNPTTDPSGPATLSGPEAESTGGDDGEDDDDDDKGCSVGARDTALAPWLAVVLLCTWRRRITPVAGSRVRARGAIGL